MLEIGIDGILLRVLQGDITEQDVDVIVNAANSSLMGGGGVDGAIHRKGGQKILEECKQIRSREWPEGLSTGKVAITSGGNLKARYVIHTVGPIWHGGKSGEKELLKNAYLNSLKLAVQKELKSISFPSISTGAYGYPIYEAAKTALNTVKEFLEQKNGLKEVNFVLFTEADLNTYKDVVKEIFGSR
ncbi:O-acetyl-ADP-ribose deacetylase [Candidatus Bathyarchaeota archaeon RBG_13_38_9]|nr:MAG: O-acetyl-ADP-ribose deacetylase [Candidatus Bathyarchaeota archaeon RBG_13_38_9]